MTSAEGSEGRRCGGYSFPRAAITRYHQLSGLKQQSFFLQLKIITKNLKKNKTKQLVLILTDLEA